MSGELKIQGTGTQTHLAQEVRIERSLLDGRDVECAEPLELRGGLWEVGVDKGVSSSGMEVSGGKITGKNETSSRRSHE